MLLDVFGRDKLTALLAGATAGLCVDLAVYPLDTIKTRLQSSSRSITSIGHLRLFAGLPAVLLGSAPGAALFFSAYEVAKKSTRNAGAPIWISSMLAASLGEIVACVVRVPCETVKQRAQHQAISGVTSIVSSILRTEGVYGMYRGYLGTIFREIPFSLIQYPVWEVFKRRMEVYNMSSLTQDCSTVSLSKMQFALCGGMAGAFAGACTTPLDVVKTRIMLAEKGTAFSTSNVFTVMRLVYAEAGITGLFAGIVPRVSMLSIGGAIFLGIYEISKQFWSHTLKL